jgi:steroid 5-alpha reductase family enzyme
MSAFVHIMVGYIVSFVAAFLAATTLGNSFFEKITLFQAVSVVVLFVFSCIYNNSSFMSAYWSVVPILVSWFLAFQNGALELQNLLVLIVVTAWGLRLTYNWTKNWRGFHQEDWDWLYGDLRQKSQVLYWLVSFAAYHFFPAVLVFLGMLPLYPALSQPLPLNLLGGVAFFVGLGAIVLETIGDHQLYQFRQSKPPAEQVLDTGLWAHTRHPNYLGEMGFWVSLALFGLAANPAEWWRMIGAIAMIALFVFASIPMIERRHLARRPGYAAYQQRVPMVIPKLSNK